MKNPSRTSSAASASTASTSESASDHQQHVLPHALRSQLGQLLPKHALFQVHVKVEQLSNVPLISGQFAVRWKFKNVQSRSGLLSKMKANRSWPSRNKGKGRASDVGLAIEVTPAEEEVYSYVEDDTGDGSSPEYDGTDDESYRRRASSGDFPQEPETAVPPVTPTPGIVQQAPSTSSAPEQRPGEPRSVARGVTPWRPLQNYNVKMNYDVNVLVQMDVHRETSALLPNELKLVVMQVCRTNLACYGVIVDIGTAGHPRRPELASATTSRRGLPQPSRVCRRGAGHTALPPAGEQDERDAESASPLPRYSIILLTLGPADDRA